MLNYHHLRYFWIVAHEGNLTRAARRINLSQSALSMQISALERDLGQPLFTRTGRRLLLTEAGRLTLDYADSIFTAGEELLSTLSATPTAPKRTLQVGALATLSRNFQSQFLAPLLAQPDAQVIVRVGQLADLLTQLDAFELDVILTNVAPVRQTNDRWVTHAIDTQPVSLVGPPHNPWLGQPLSALLSTAPLAVPTRPSSIRNGFDALVSRLGVVPNVVAEVDDMAMLRLVARQHTGLSVVPPIVVKDELDQGTLVEVAALPGLVEQFLAITLTRKFPNPLLAVVLPPPHPTA